MTGYTTYVTELWPNYMHILHTYIRGGPIVVIVYLLT